MRFNADTMMRMLIKYTSLGRTLNPEYPPNLAIMILTPLIGIVAGIWSIYSGESFWQATQAGFFTSAATLATWAISREADPDNDWSAFVGVVLAVIAMFWLGFPILGIVAFLPLIAGPRLVSRIVGPPATIYDTALGIILVLLLAIGTNWILALNGALLFFLDATMVNPLRRHYAAAAICVGVFVGRIAIAGLTTVDSLSTPYLIAMIVIAIAYFLTVIANRHIDSVTDARGYELHVERVRAGMMIVLTGALITALWNGDTAMVLLLPVWAAMLGISIYRLPITVRELLQFQQRRAG